jgi:uncharacterized SAM-binding protein YcdF (DUF218 family)
VIRAGRRRRHFRVAAGLALVVGLAMAAPRAGTALIVTRTVAAPDAILVLASHEWERLPEAAEQSRQAPAAAVLLTVPRVITDRNCHRCAERGDWLVTLGVDSRRLTLLPRSVTNTRDEALAALAFCRQQQIRRLLIVTSPYHTRRTLATFDHVFEGSGVQVGVAGSSAHSPARAERWWAAAYDRWYVRYEWSAIGFYVLRYGIMPWP